MIYLDNAATTLVKPQSVRTAVINSFNYCANPGRSGHKLSIKAAQSIYECREKLCSLFNFDSPEKVILTSGCTFSLNTVIKGVLKKGDHAIISSLEHNSVLRPLEQLRKSDLITYDVAKVYENDDDSTFESFRELIKPETKLVICTHGSNVFGIKLPISRISALCRYYGISCCIDLAQSAGIIDIDVSDIGADYYCLPGHKGLYGPMGTGALIINSKKLPDSLCAGGTGSSSLDYSQPESLPDKFESGTLNLHGYAGLSKGIDFVKIKTPKRIHNYEIMLLCYLYDGLSELKNVILYTDRPSVERNLPVLSFNVRDISCEDVATYLDSRYNIAVRSGLHCSPLAHKTFSTQNIGTVRASTSIFNTKSDINALINALYTIKKH